MNKRDALKILKRLIRLIPDEMHWTKAALARDKDGTTAFFDANEAVCFCLLGGCRRSGGGKEIFAELARTIREEQNRKFSKRDELHPGKVLVVYNDVGRRTYAQVRSIMDKTLVRVKRVGLTALAAAS